jgi:hypothetical protein
VPLLQVLLLLVLLLLLLLHGLLAQHIAFNAKVKPPEAPAAWPVILLSPSAHHHALVVAGGIIPPVPTATSAALASPLCRFLLLLLLRADAGTLAPVASLQLPCGCFPLVLLGSVLLLLLLQRMLGAVRVVEGLVADWPPPRLAGPCTRRRCCKVLLLQCSLCKGGGVKLSILTISSLQQRTFRKACSATLSLLMQATKPDPQEDTLPKLCAWSSHGACNMTAGIQRQTRGMAHLWFVEDTVHVSITTPA